MTGSTSEHTLAHLARLDLLIRREVLRQRLRQPSRGDDEFRGLYISDEDVEALLERQLATAPTLSATHPTDEGLRALDDGIAALDARLAGIETASGLEPGQAPRLVRLVRLFGLSEFERDVLVVCLAAELDLKYERLYAYLQDDVTKKRPTVDLVMRLLCPTLETRLAARGSFLADRPLMRWSLVSLNDDPGARRPVLLARYLKLDERVAGYLLGSDTLDPRLAALAPMAEAEPAVGLSDGLRVRLTSWGEAWERSWPARPPVALFRGRYGAGRIAAAGLLASGLGRPLLMLSAAELVGGDGSLADGLALAEREALLVGALLGWCDVDALLHPPPGEESGHRTFVRALSRGRAPTLLLSEKGWEPGHQLAGRPFLHLELPETSPTDRRDAWAVALNGLVDGAAGHEAGTLAGRFRLTPGQIHDAVARARTLAWARDPLNGHPAAADVEAACRAQSQHRLGTLARKLTPRYRWDDIVLPRPQLTTLRLIGATVRQRPVVYGDWGFDRKHSRGKGLIALFAGPSGTGKTMASEIIANDLGLDLYRIDLASVVSKYIGETEKNLERIFAEAQDSDAILFFDEADALFGRRSEVKDAHDRYANIEIAYLLQRTEEYDGLVILASNLKKSMDEAFVRRLHFTVDFPMPEEPERLEIWRRSFPLETPLAEDIDLPFMARKLKIAGGNIRNIVLTSAFLAAEDGEPVSMRHLVRATGLELQKMGRLVVEDDFEQHSALVRT